MYLPTLPRLPSHRTNRATVFWPPKAYHSDAKITLSWDASTPLVLLQNNTGNDTLDVTPYMYDYRATWTPGTPNERGLKISFLERRFNDVEDPLNLEQHDGPVVILVKTAAWPSRTSAGSGPTGSAGAVDHSHDFENDDDAKVKGIIAGVVVGVVAVIVLMGFFCCRQCCCPGRRERKVKVRRVDIGKIVHTHLNGVSEGAVGRRQSGDEISRVEENRGERDEEIEREAHDDPPPKYTP